MAGTGEYWNGMPFALHAQQTTWAISLSPELAKEVIGVAKASGIFTSLLERILILELADRVPSAPASASCSMTREVQASAQHCISSRVARR